LLAACSGGGGAGFTTTAPISAGATDGELSLPFSVDVEATGTSRLGTVKLDASAGDVVVDGVRASAAVVGRADFFDEEVYQVLAVSPDRWDVLWIYCSQGAVRGAYVESTATPGPVAAEPMTGGTCAEHPDAATVHARFPAFGLSAPAFPASSRLALAGSGLSYDGQGSGKIVVDGRTLELYPFGLVDCTKGCGDRGWYEVHALMWDAGESTASFGVLYLDEDADRSIDLAYTISLPRLYRDADEISFPHATWSYSP
jgi:hypothetical protein